MRAGPGARPRPWRRVSPRLAGFLIALVAATAYAASQVITRHVVTELATPLVSASFALLFGTAVLFAFGGRGIMGGIGSSRSGFLLFALAGVCSTMGVILFFVALSRAPVVVVSPIVALNPLLVILLSRIFLRRLERITLRLVMGTGLVVVGIVIITIDTALR